MSKEEILKSMNEAYEKAGENAYFANGFMAGFEKCHEQIKPLIDEIEMLKFQLKAADSDYQTMETNLNEALRRIEYLKTK